MFEVICFTAGLIVGWLMPFEKVKEMSVAAYNRLARNSE